jgi:hypothetical protein
VQLTVVTRDYCAVTVNPGLVMFDKAVGKLNLTYTDT